MTPETQLQAPLAPEQIQQLVNQLMGIGLALKNMLVVHLSSTRSVNISNVCAYEMREKLKLDKKGEPVVDGETGELVGLGEFLPVIVYVGGAESELTPDENMEFREKWEQFASLNGQASALIKLLFPEPSEEQTPDVSVMM